MNYETMKRKRERPGPSVPKKAAKSGVFPAEKDYNAEFKPLSRNPFALRDLAMETRK